MLANIMHEGEWLSFCKHYLLSILPTKQYRMKKLMCPAYKFTV